MQKKYMSNSIGLDWQIRLNAVKIQSGWINSAV